MPKSMSKSLRHSVWSCLILLAACQGTGAELIVPASSPGASSIAATASPTGATSPSAQPNAIATSDISTAYGTRLNQGSLPPSTPTPLPTSQTPPQELGPTAIPSNVSPNCPAGETYTLPPLTGPNSTPPPLDPRFPPPPLTPFQARYQHSLPLDITQSRFCSGAMVKHWYVDTAGVLTVITPDAPKGESRQLSAAQTAELVALLDADQLHQWTDTQLYRCQAAEVCPLVNAVHIGTGSDGGQTGWSERGNLVYPEIYQQGMQALLDKLEAFYSVAPVTQSKHIYRPSLGVTLLDGSGQAAGLRFLLTPDGWLRAALPAGISPDESSKRGKQLTAEQRTSFRSLLQTLDPMSQYDNLPGTSNQTPYQQPATGETIWNFDFEPSINTSYGGGSIYSSRIPDTAAGQALRTDLARIEAQLDTWKKAF